MRVGGMGLFKGLLARPIRSLSPSTAITWSVTTALWFGLSATITSFRFNAIVTGLYWCRLHRLLLKRIINHPCYDNDEDEAKKV